MDGRMDGWMDGWKWRRMAGVCEALAYRDRHEIDKGLGREALEHLYSECHHLHSSRR